jgi:hypothetical protein
VQEFREAVGQDKQKYQEFVDTFDVDGFAPSAPGCLGAWEASTRPDRKKGDTTDDM